MNMSFLEELKRRNVIRVGIAYGVTAWLLLQLADVILGNIAAPGWVFQVIMLVLGIGFPIVMIFAWAFEMTPEGIKREKDVDRTQSITPQTGRKLDRAIIGVLAVVVIYLLVDKLVLQDAASPTTEPVTTAETEASADAPEGPSVAVLPFVNMSGDAENEYFSDGLTETLLHMLAQLPDLRVAARTSSFAFKGQNSSITEIADTLNVAHILEGSVQKSGERVRVTAQLIRADDGFHVWSQNYTRPLEDIFAIQDEIAGDVADALGTSLLGNAGAAKHVVDTQNLSAYDSYLKGLEQQAIFSYGSLEIAENHFKQALARDPEFTEARLALVRNYLLKNGTGLIDEQGMRAAIGPLLEQVRARDPDSHLARALELTAELQTFNLARTGDETRAIVEELRGLLSVLPTETYIRERVGQSLFFFFNDQQPGMEVIQAGLMIDPLSADLRSVLGAFYRQQDRLDDAREEIRRAIELAPDSPNHYGDLSRLEKEADNLPASLDAMRKAAEVDPQDPELAYNIAEDLYFLELPEEADRWKARIDALAPQSGIARSAAVKRASARQEFDEAIRLAEAALADRIDLRQGAFFDVAFRYVDMMTRQGRGQEGWEFYQSISPEVSNYDELPGTIQDMALKWTSFALRLDFESQEDLADDWTKFTDTIERMGFPWKADPADQNWLWDYILSGQPEKAVAHYLEHRVNQPLATNLVRHTRPMPSLFEPLWNDPRISEFLDEDAKRFVTVRQEVRDMLQRPEWQ